MLQHVGANDVIELAAQGRRPLSRSAPANSTVGGCGLFGPINAGNGEPPLCQNFREVSDSAAHVEHARPSPRSGNSASSSV